MAEPRPLIRKAGKLIEGYCGECKHFSPDGVDCRRYAPSPRMRGAVHADVISSGEDNPRQDLNVWWPVVDPSDDWCSEFKPDGSE